VSQIPCQQADKVADGGASTSLSAQHDTPPNDGKGKKSPTLLTNAFPKCIFAASKN